MAGAFVTRVLPEPSPVYVQQTRGLKPDIPDYELLRQIGRGSYGDVWLAQGLTGVYRAVKVVWRERFPDPEPFEREFKGLKGFASVSLTESRHLALLHVGRNEPGGFFYYVMELADDYENGRLIEPGSYVPFTFKELRSRRGRIPAEEVSSLGIELTRGLIGLHDKHLIHRDIKPSNVIMVGGVPKLADIGLVTMDSDANTFVGTEGFVPPEGPGTATADVYSLGKLLYEMATGLDRKDYPRLPPNLHEFEDRKALLELNEVLVRACEPDQARRYGTAQALLDDLYLLQAGRSLRRLRTAEKSVKRAGRAIALLVIVAAVAALGALFEKSRAAQETTRREAAEAERDRTAQKMAYAGGMAKAERASELNSPGRARRYLRDIVPAGSAVPRELEWRALWNDSAGSPSDIYYGPGGMIFRSCLSPDGTLLAAGSADASGRYVELIWDVRTRKLLHTIPGVYRINGFSTDGKWLVGIDDQEQIQRWSARTFLPDGPPPPPADHQTYTFSPSGPSAELAFSQTRAAFVLWDFEQHKIIREVPAIPLDNGLHGACHLAEASADGRFAIIAFLASDPRVHTWKIEAFDLKAGTCLWQLPISTVPLALAISPNGRYAAVALPFSPEVTVTDLSTHQVAWSRRLSTEDIDALRFSPDGTRLAGGGKDSEVWVVDTAAGLNRADFRGHEGGVSHITWSVSPMVPFSSDRNGAVRRWQLDADQDAGRYDAFETNVGEPMQCVSPDGRWFAATLPGGASAIVDTRGQSPRRILPDVYIPLAFLDSQRLVTVSRLGVQRTWSVDTGLPIGDAIHYGDGIATVSYAALSPDHTMIAITGASFGLQIRRLDTGTVLFHPSSSVQRWLAFSHDSRRLVAGQSYGATTTWDLASQKALATWADKTRSLAGALAPDDRWVAVGLNTNEVHILSFPGLKEIETIRTDSGRANCLAAAPDGRRLLVGGSAGSIHVYDTADWREVAVLTEREHPTGRNYDGMEYLSISANEETLIGYRADGFIRAWDCRNSAD